MMNADDQIYGVVMVCSPLGIIEEIAYPEHDVPQYFEIGENILFHVEPESLSKALSFMQLLNSQRFASNHEVNFKVAGRIKTIYLSGFFKDDKIMIIGNARVEAFNNLNEELMKINSEQINTFRLALKETMKSREIEIKDKDKNTYNHYDEISKLNNELLNSQRELAQKNQQLNKLNSDLERMATRDPLTGLYNRRLLVEKYQDEKRRSVRLDYPLAMVVIDINHFKKVNDQFGHAEGDLLLIRLSNLLIKFTRESLDFAFRIGGDEFLLLLANCDKANAEGILKRINETFKTFSDIATLAYGVIEIDQSCDEDLDRCMNKADALMFENKKGSR